MSIPITTDRRSKNASRRTTRKSSMVKRRLRERAELNDIATLMKRVSESELRNDFIEALRPIIYHLGNYARRELRLMEAYGALKPDVIIFADLLDEVVNRASMDFDDRPRWLEFGLWLTKIVDELLEEQCHQVGQSQETF